MTSLYVVTCQHRKLTADGCVHADDTTKLSPTSFEFVFTPPTPTRQNSFVASASAVCIGHEQWGNEAMTPSAAWAMRAATAVQQLCKSRRACFKFYCMFYFTCDRSLKQRVKRWVLITSWGATVATSTVSRSASSADLHVAVAAAVAVTVESLVTGRARVTGCRAR